MTLVSPSYTITIADKPYLLDGSFATLRAVQETFRKDIVQILIGVMDMRFDEICRLIAIGAGKPGDDGLIGQDILDSFGALHERLHRSQNPSHRLAIYRHQPQGGQRKKKNRDGRDTRNAEGPQLFPWEDYQQFCFGCLRWGPNEFWRSNVWEVSYAYDGYAISKGVKQPDDNFMTRDELETLMRRFPD